MRPRGLRYGGDNGGHLGVLSVGEGEVIMLWQAISVEQGRSLQWTRAVGGGAAPIGVVHHHDKG